MGGPWLVRVVGFGDAERHALNAVFRLSAESAVPLGGAPLNSDAGVALYLVDGESAEAREWACVGMPPQVPVLWVGPAAPEGVAGHFSRPLAWPEMIAAMQSAISQGACAPTQTLALDEGPSTQPMPLGEGAPRALIASPAPERRLYWRAKLALNGLPDVEMTDTAGGVLEAIEANRFRVAVVDLDGWPRSEALGLVRRLSESPSKVGRILALSQRRDLGTRASAWFAGAAATMQSPPHPQRFQQFLRGLAESDP